MKRFALLILASSGVATAGLAQDISYGGLSLSYGAYSDGSGNDLSLTTLSGELGLQFGAFDANIAASRSELSEDSIVLAACDDWRRVCLQRHAARRYFNV